MENFAKALTYYLEPAEGTSKEEFINTFSYSVLVENSEMVAPDKSSLFSSTEMRNDNRDVLHPITASSESISNNRKVFELRKRLNSQATDIFVGRAPTNDVVLDDPAVSKSHFRFISIPGSNHLQLADMFSTKGTYLNGKKIDPLAKYQVEDHDEISFGTEYQLVYYSPQGFYEMLIGLKDNESKDGEQEQTADDDLALLLDTIERETTDLTETVSEEKSLPDHMAPSGEDDLALLDPGVLEGDDFELDRETLDDSARASTEIETKEQDSGIKLDNQGEDEKMLTENEVVSGKDDAAMTDTSKVGTVQFTDKKLTEPAATTPELEPTRPLDDATEKEQATEAVPAFDDQLLEDPFSDNQGEDEKMLTENEVVSGEDDAAMTDTSKVGAVQFTDKKLTEPAATTPELEATRPLDDATEKEQATEAVPAFDDQLLEDPFSDYELADEFEEKGGEADKPNLNALSDELGALLNERMEAIVTRLLEERLPVIVEPIILQTIKKLLKSSE